MRDKKGQFIVGHSCNVKDLCGQKFGRLTVIKDTGERSKHGNVLWLCRCDCGNLTINYSGHLCSGRTKSCGCLNSEKSAKRKMIHGDTRNHEPTRLYRIWIAMKKRCSNPKSISYRYYGGKGISVCPEWASDYMTFKTWALTNGYQNNLTIDRIDHIGNYCPENCQWLTKSENSKKARRQANKSSGLRCIVSGA